MIPAASTEAESSCGRACDPEVGVGAKQAICLDFCERWYEDCRDDYFAFRELRGNLAPCSHGSLICSELQVPELLSLPSTDMLSSWA